MTRARWSLAVAGAALVCSLACKDDPPAPPLDIVVDGCTSWAPDGACEHTPDTELRVWTEARGDLGVRADDEALTFTSTHADTGRRLTFALPADARALEVSAGPAKARLTLTPVATATPTDPVRRRARALLDGGRSALRAGEQDLAVRRLTASASVARSRGDEATAMDADLLAAFVEIVLQGDVRAASTRLENSTPPLAVDGRGRILLRYHRGLFARRVADARSALLELDEALLWARRIDSPYVVQAMHERALVLMNLGRSQEAAVAFDGLLERIPRSDACDWAAAAVSAGWARTLGRPPFEVERARALFSTAEAIYEEECPRPPEANNVRVNLGLLDASTPARARAHLARVRGSEQTVSMLWRRALESRLHSTRGELASAARGYRALRRLARVAKQAPLEWQAELGLGLVARRRGRPAEAIRRFEAAEGVLDRQSELVPLNRGRRFLLEDRSESLQLLVAEYARVSDVSSALRAVRRARRRTARSAAMRDALGLLSSKARLAWSESMHEYKAARAEVRELVERAWTAPESEAGRLEAKITRAEERTQKALDRLLHAVAPSRLFDAEAPSLPDVPEDTLLVVPFSGSAGHRVFVARGARTAVIEAPTKAAGLDWSEVLGDWLEGTARVRVLSDPGSEAAGPASAGGSGEPAQNVEAAMWKGRPLAATLPVAYSVDLGAPPPPSEPAEGALVVFDPRGDLADARTEGVMVATALDGRFGPVRSLGPLEASPAAVLSALSGRRLFHFAGHAEHRGPQGWQSALVLTDGTLDMGDLLTLPEPPPWVVLTGCETARTRAGQVSAGLGLSQVLLAAGTEVVVATRAPVDSRVALDFSRALYAALDSSPDLEQAFVGAVRALHQEGQRWQDFLLLVRQL